VLLKVRLLLTVLIVIIITVKGWQCKSAVSYIYSMVYFRSSLLRLRIKMITGVYLWLEAGDPIDLLISRPSFYRKSSGLNVRITPYNKILSIFPE
jgi:hypothetical protein